MEIADLNLSVRTFNAVCRAEIKTVPELYDMYQCNSEKLRLLVGNKHFEEIGDALAKHREEVWEENRKADEPTAPPDSTVIVSEDYTRAVTLTRSIIANAQAAQQSLYEVCKGLKEMRDGELFKELGYKNFEDYCNNEVEITYRQAKKYVAIASGFEGSRLPSIGTEKLYLLAKLDEPTRQEVTESVDVESVTVKDMKAQITALTQERDEAQAAADKKDKQFRQAIESKNNEIVEVKTGWKRRSDMLMTKIKMLQDELKAAKMEPQEVAVEDTSRVEELEQQLAKAHSELADATAKLNERPMVQTALPGDGGERRRGEYAAITNAVSNALEDLMDFLEDNDQCRDFRYFATKAKEKLRTYNSKLNDMLAKEESSCQ